MNEDDQIEVHRDRWLSLFIGGYSAIGVIVSIGVGVAATSFPSLPRTVSIYSGVACVATVALLFAVLRRFYDWLAFSPQPKTEIEKKIFEQNGQRRAKDGRVTRRRLEYFVHLMLVLHILALVAAIK